MSNEILAVSTIEAARRLGVSPRTIVYLLARNELASRKIGRRRVIPISALEDLLQKDRPTRERGDAKHDQESLVATSA